MPQNRFIYWGIVVLVATLSLWAGAELTRRVEWILPYTGSLAALMIVGGFAYEWWRARKAAETSREGPPPAATSPDPAPMKPPGTNSAPRSSRGAADGISNPS
ncbi:MAG: hypothetical protein KF791_00455 [Verrucomicrobiae bacterium]|nr:hypothetical protein [Verrucomicrobiae bacterium]